MILKFVGVFVKKAASAWHSYGSFRRTTFSEDSITISGKTKECLNQHRKFAKYDLLTHLSAAYKNPVLFLFLQD